VLAHRHDGDADEHAGTAANLYAQTYPDSSRSADIDPAAVARSS